MQIPGVNKSMYKIIDQRSGTRAKLVQVNWIHCKDPSNCWLLVIRGYNMNYLINSIKMELKALAQYPNHHFSSCDHGHHLRGYDLHYPPKKKKNKAFT
uniref:Uncharacterized protein n=1 Tax=Populus trichocarpa TaxID=3694 RepID=U5GAR9_POPTR